MTPKDAICNTLDMSEMIVGAYTSDLSDAELLVRPVPGMNHIAWQIGHLIESERGMVEILRPGTSPALPAGFAEAHSKEAASSDDPAKFHKLAEYQALWKAQREATKKVVDSFSDSELDNADANLPSYAPTVGALLNMTGIHVLMHSGQFVAVRRLLGKPVTI